MKKSLLLAVAVLALSACGTLSPTGAKTPAQIANQVCPVVQPTLVALQSLVGLAPNVEADLVVANTVVGTVCAVGAQVTAGNLQALVGQAFPALVAAVQSSPLPATQKNQIVLDLSAAQIIVSGALALNPPVTGLGLGVSIAAPAPATAASK